MATTRSGGAFDRVPFDALLKRRLFFTPSFEIYRTASGFAGDTKGLFDYGPPGCALQANLVDTWRKHFVLEENMLELDCTVLTPEDVFKTSGHVDKFSDWMCKDSKNGDYLRADHLIENVLEARLKGDKAARGIAAAEEKDTSNDPAAAKKKKRAVKDIKSVKLDDAVAKEFEEILARIDNYDGLELGALIKKFDIRNPDGNNEVLPPVPFNLMFKTSIGPSSGSIGYLRPETAQGQFVNFKKLLDFNQNTMPFASASIGKSYRNEISPRTGILRVREFLMAEVEHFVDPEGGKKHERFEDIDKIELVLLDRHTQLAGSTEIKVMTVGEAVRSHVIDNETLGYFLARIHLFFQKIGVDPKKVRFRQHMANEMAHYAADCWDGELLTSYGWIECVGCADRSAYDLSVHSKRTGEALVVREPREQPLKIEEWQVDIDKKKLGPKFRKNAKAVEEAIEALSQEQRERFAQTLDNDGAISIDVSGLPEGQAELDKALIQIVRRTRVENIREYTPNVIEPSFGIGRIFYCLLEHVYWHRPGDVARGVLSIPPLVAPSKVLIVPLSRAPGFAPHVKKLSARLRTLGISHTVDDSSASIGKRYSRNDELGTPFGITVDFDSLKDDTITLRERDTTKQIRASVNDVLAAVVSLVNGTELWTDVLERLPEFLGQSEDE
ncbi:putative glycine--tRNA ligase [Lachnellula occidentalis]|uniref:glycine--tRNA ligase n=1 Tax=Lachnellula occidentalis TaxID=215460 RepID=A0A8H8S4K0_9HELO|nr:putative glycine--tRNA ligase [Lachnellula occidentalis]